MHKHKVLLGFDFGMKRIGVAVGQTITCSAQALTVLAAKDGIPNWQLIAELLQTWHTDGCVIGAPYNMDGSHQHVTYAAKKFAARLREKFKLPVYLMDERLTTIEAKAQLYAKPKASRTEIDSYAAKLILESWLTSSVKDEKS